jgi:hypothetical protein
MLAYLDLWIAVDAPQRDAMHVSIDNATQRRATLTTELQTGPVLSRVRRQKIFTG